MTTKTEPACRSFERLLSEQRTLVADGAMGTTLFEMGLESGGCPELLNVEQPDLVRRVHQAFVDAGADIILTNTFGGNRRRLALHRLEDRVAELNAAAVRVAASVRDAADHPVLVAGSIGPTGDLFEPLGPLTIELGVEVFAEQAEALAAAGADVLWIETLSSWDELAAAVEGCSGLGLPVTATLSFDTNGKTMMGLSPREFGEWWQTKPDPPLAIGANCGIGPGDAVAAAFDITTVAPDALVIAKANCGVPLYKTDAPEYPVGPEGMADYVELAVRSGARIIGSCCGSTPAHVAAIRAAVDAGVAGPRPERAEIEQRLEAAPDTPPQARRTRTRRRG
ncbi:MAG: betaine--homocysteine S-methyltransferase [Acidimicrobiia bacterium]|nr:betaine--homocysteine S-methyltransferase [Acidimicrobiia bacterium]